MTCSKVRTSLSAMNDCRLRESERASTVEHLAECSDCRRHERELRTVSLALKEAIRQRPPLDLTYRLRVLASHERARMLRGSDWWSTIRFRLNQILRPLAVPAAGGILSSLLFFAILTPSFAVHAANTRNDTPVWLYTQSSIVNPSPFGFSGRDIMVEVTVDENGRATDYSVQGGKLSRDEMLDVANFILFTSFRAATAFGQPVSSKLLLSIDLSHITQINVRS
jgi:hypothetical protein